MSFWYLFPVHFWEQNQSKIQKWNSQSSLVLISTSILDDICDVDYIKLHLVSIPETSYVDWKDIVQVHQLVLQISLAKVWCLVLLQHPRVRQFCRRLLLKDYLVNISNIPEKKVKFIHYLMRLNLASCDNCCRITLSSAVLYWSNRWGDTLQKSSTMVTDISWMTPNVRLLSVVSHSILLLNKQMACSSCFSKWYSFSLLQ